jgi:hypothetical protein
MPSDTQIVNEKAKCLQVQVDCEPFSLLLHHLRQRQQSPV